MRTKISLMLSLLCLPLAFWACGDDSSSGASADDYSAVSDLESSSSSSKDVIASSSAAKQSISSSSEGEAASSSSAKGSSSSENAESSSSDSYLCHIYDLSDALSCECDKSREGKLSYNYDSDVELVCYHDEYLDKWGWVKKTDENSSSSDGSSSFSVVPGSESLSSATTEGKSSSSLAEGQVDPATVVKDEMTDERDGQVYKTVKIGDQTWMVENLNYAYNEPTAKEDSSSFCYKNSADFCAKYGRLYLWSAAMDSAAVFSKNGKGCGYGSTCNPSSSVRGVCPKGWHLPSNAEWDTLFTAVGGSRNAGNALKTGSGWFSNGNGKDAYGFSAHPAGCRYSRGGFDDASENAYFWSSSEYNIDSTYIVDLSDFHENVRLHNDHKNFAFSVRCLKD